MIGGPALFFVAIPILHATAFQLGVLSAAGILPGFLVALIAGSWADRLRRRPILIAADIGRAVLLATIPVAAMNAALRIEQLYVVTLLVSFLTVFFDVAYQSYLPALIDSEELVEGNSKLSASAAIAEVSGLALAGWLVKIFTAPIAIFVDAISFAVSAASVWLIKAPESPPAGTAKPSMSGEVLEGLRAVIHNRILKTLAMCTLSKEFFGGVYGTLVMLYMIRDLGFSPGILGSIWAIGGISSLAGAALCGRVTQRFGIGPTMIFGLSISASASLLIPLAHGVTLGAAVLLIVQQICGDGFATVYQIDQVSLRQAIAAKPLLGRVNASTEFIRRGATLGGSLAGGFLAESLGVRPVLFYATGGMLLSTLVLVFSPVRRLRSIPVCAHRVLP